MAFAPLETIDLLPMLSFFAPKVVAAICCGGMVGLERELKNKPAGIKTNMLICLGAALYTSVSIWISESISGSGHYGDPSRVAAQIVSGIGFLGGGTIIQARGTILGLTTAATIWVVAAIGVFIGVGRIDAAVFSSFVVILVLVSATLFEDRILGRAVPFICEIVAEDAKGEVRASINQALADNELTLDDFRLAERGKYSTLVIHYSGHRVSHKKFMMDLWNIPEVREIRQH